MASRTEDEVRDSAKVVLGFDQKETDIIQGTGQLTTFNRLGFKGVNDKPDGWYLPKDTNKIAIVLETKSEDEDLQNNRWVSELHKNITIIKQKYSRIIGILYNGIDIRVFKVSPNNPIIEVENTAPNLQHKSYYLSLFSE